MPESSVAPPGTATPAAKPSQVWRLFQVLLTYAWYISAVFLGAGRLNWTRGWISVALSVVCMTALGLVAQRYNPELMAQRARWRRKDTKRFDKTFLSIYLPLVLFHPVLAGLDAVRFRWSSMPFAFVYVGGAIYVASAAVIGWVMVVNPYAESSVRIQNDRGHAAVSSGPYRFVRHPMYVGVIVMGIAMPLVWGSLWALLLGGVTAMMFVVRTALEDLTLRRELPGYEEYAARTRYRLIPGVW